MLKKAFRLPQTESFASSRVVHDRAFSLKVKKQMLPHSRFGVVVSKKVDKRAVVRNTLRRKVHAIIQEENLFERPGYDMLVILKPGVTEIEDFSERIKTALIKTSKL